MSVTAHNELSLPLHYVEEMLGAGLPSPSRIVLEWGLAAGRTNIGFRGLRLAV